MAKTGGVFSHCWKRVVLLLATVSLTGVACTKNPEVAPADKAAATPTAAAAAPAAPTPAAPPPEANSANSLAGIPGMDFSSLPPSAQRELATVLSDEFCHCGCPHTLGACLRQHTSCKHAKKTARLAAMNVANGMPATEVILGLSRYYASFRATRATLKVDPRMCMGDEKAPVTIAEFADFECPSCGHARPLLEGFAKKNTTKVRFCYLPYPLPSHPNALPAAQAALWARDQGKFWEMHDILFENQGNLAPAALPALADKIGLPGAKLAEALKAGAYVKELEGIKGQGNAAGITGTPTVFLNGRSHTMGIQADQLNHAVDDEIEWQANNNAWAAD
jgi:protein-disulfide isomerase